MTVTRIWADGQFVTVTGTGYTPNGEFLVNGAPVSLKQYPAILTTLWLGALNNDAEIETGGPKARVIGDPTEAALIVAAEKAGASRHALHRAHRARVKSPSIRNASAWSPSTASKTRTPTMLRPSTMPR